MAPQRSPSSGDSGDASNPARNHKSNHQNHQIHSILRINSPDSSTIGQVSALERRIGSYQHTSRRKRGQDDDPRWKKGKRGGEAQ
uniref:Uncharacterized protein n=1 Tax=Arundo donax TaxID=35708 RepID=A0A0A9HBB3_ARUDO